MAGGIGSRFWPMSRSARPKQFLDILGLGRTLLQQTYDRFLPLCGPDRILVVTSHAYADLVMHQLPELNEDQLVLEPSRRNTAPCVAFANERIARQDPDALVIVAPSDHLVTDVAEFHSTLQLALEQATAGDGLVTLGIMPNRPDTGYGYIQFDTQETLHHPKVKRVRTFTEKPDLETARRFLESGDFLWNSGIFIWSLKSIQTAFTRHLPTMAAQFAEGRSVYGTPGETAFVERTYAGVESISIDYGILEKSDRVFVVVSDFGWSDLGTWGSLYTHLEKDAEGNAVVGGPVRIYGSGRNVVHAQDGRLVVVQGLEDHIVVSTPDALLICPLQEEQRIRQFVSDATAEWGDRYI